MDRDILSEDEVIPQIGEKGNFNHKNSIIILILDYTKLLLLKGREAQRCEQDLEQKKKLQRDKDFEIKNLERNISNCEDDISKCMNAKKNQILKFGDYMLALVTDIKKYPYY